jgi:hypothetical protein
MAGGLAQVEEQVWSPGFKHKYWGKKEIWAIYGYEIFKCNVK